MIIIIKNRKLINIFITLVLIGGVLVVLTNHQSKQVQTGRDNNITVNVKSFNATADDRIDDTHQIQKAIDHVDTKGGGTVSFSQGVYLIDSLKSINLRDKITLKFEEGTTLKTLPNNAESYEILRIHNVKNVSILGDVTLLGEREEHKGKTGEWGIGISIRGSENVYIKNNTIQNFWGDGIYIGSTEQQNYSKNITIEKPIIKNNRRQGISVISAINLKIIDPVITNTNGTPPASGIDFEPNHPSEFLQGIKIINPTTEKNEGYGILFALSGFAGSNHPVSIEIHKTKQIRDNIGTFIPGHLKGHIKMNEEYVLKNPK
ncbi:glycosyl hydrolase family 28-related protein [Peribacillus sp. JNUCC41]|uniref:glycosyl hydrolase family 28-related protein n=1 Tax=Peribacillus sp. JNUCC41 TaxID=2778370 RepID=UPI00177D81D6|nr:glycosyl hydrolase family 28-related protein [Brevibacillus sp. JNUCC-41]QOS90294.1 right-handed parallel beta-helix repeat-containing protein [Brevibacillus sp. JNUCC-41]